VVRLTILGAYIVPHPPLIVPDVGGGEEKEIQKTIDAYHQIAREIKELNPDTIIITSPHSVIYQDYIHISPGESAYGSFRDFGDPDTRIFVDYDQELANEIETLALEDELPAGTLGERNPMLDHGTIVPLFFIDQYVKNYKIVRISISGLSFLDHYRFGKCIKAAAENLDRKIVFVASGDLSHMLKNEGSYGFATEGPLFDSMVTKAMAEGDFLQFLKFDTDFCRKAAECGLRSFIIMAGALDGLAVESRLLSYEGPFGVGYAVAAFKPTGPDKNRRFDNIYIEQKNEEIRNIRRQEDPYVKLARLSLETYVRNGLVLSMPKDLPAELLNTKAGVFVSIKKDGNLRGCIGTIEPVRSCVAEEIIHNAIAAGTEDTRFEPVTENELDSLIYSVDVLMEPEPVKSMAELDVKRYGVIVSKGLRRGLLLPDLEGIETPEEQVRIALRKAGIPFKDDYQMERFEVVRHK